MFKVLSENEVIMLIDDINWRGLVYVVYICWSIVLYYFVFCNWK